MKHLLWSLMLAATFATPAWAQESMVGDIPRTTAPDPRNSELRGDLARIHEQYGSAITYYKVALKTEPKNAVLHNKLGIAYLQMRLYKDARKSFTRSTKLDPRYVNALNNLGAVDCLEKKYRPAVKVLKQALALNEANASAHLNLAEAWVGLKDMDRAMTEYARALELDADILSNNPEGVQVRVGTPEQRARVSFLIAKAYAKRGNFDGALEYLQRAKDNRYGELARVYEDPVFQPLWNDARLHKIVKP